MALILDAILNFLKCSMTSSGNHSDSSIKHIPQENTKHKYNYTIQLNSESNRNITGINWTTTNCVQ